MAGRIPADARPDISNRLIGAGEQAGGAFGAAAREVGERSEAGGAAKAANEVFRRKAGAAGELAQGPGVGEAGFHLAHAL